MTLATFPAQQLILTLLAAYGFSWVMGYSHITLRARLWLARYHLNFPLTLMECPGCLGWWLGGLVGLVYWLPGADIIILGFATSASNMVLHALVMTIDTGDEETLK